MKPTRIALAAVAATIALAGCRIDQTSTLPATGGTSTVTSTAGPGAGPSATPAVAPESLFARLRPLHDAVYGAPGDLAARAALATASFDSARGSFFVVGKGVKNLSAGSAETGQERAAEADAKRWALYLRAWTSQDTRKFAEPIEGEITYSNILARTVEDDTLYVLLQVPYSSVTVK